MIKKKFKGTKFKIVEIENILKTEDTTQIPDKKRKQADDYQYDLGYQQNKFVIGVVCGDPFNSSVALLSQYKTQHIQLFFGSDQEEKMFKNLKNYMKKLEIIINENNGIDNIKPENTRIKYSGQLKIINEKNIPPINEMSASMIRSLMTDAGIVEEIKKKIFTLLYKDFLEEKKITELFDLLKNISNLPLKSEPAKKQRTTKGGKSRKFRRQTYKKRGSTRPFGRR